MSLLRWARGSRGRWALNPWSKAPIQAAFTSSCMGWAESISTPSTRDLCWSAAAGCGANCAFVTLPARLAARPVLTGWLADPSILEPDSSARIQLGGEARTGGALRAGMCVFASRSWPGGRAVFCHGGGQPVLNPDVMPSHEQPACRVVLSHCRWATAPAWLSRAAHRPTCSPCWCSTTSCRQAGRAVHTRGWQRWQLPALPACSPFGFLPQNRLRLCPAP